MEDAVTIVRGFDRPNIWLGVEWIDDERRKREALLERVERAPKPGLVYTATRREAEELAEELASRGLRAEAYHAGIATSRREQVHEAFMADELDVVVATIAFGMGIDKPNVRFAFHAEPSDSVDSYYQELGRDGARAEAILFYRSQEVGARRFFAGAARLELEQVEAVADAVAGADGPLQPGDLENETDVSESKLATALSRLEEVGAVEVLPTGQVAAIPSARTDADASAQAVEAQERLREFERSRVEMMRAYAELRDCRREFLLNYFGEPRDEPCGFCDNCERGLVVEDGERPFPAHKPRPPRGVGRGSRRALRRRQDGRPLRRRRAQDARRRRRDRARSPRTGLAVLPTDVVNAADRGLVSERAVWPSPVVVVEPVWQGVVAVSR